MLTHIERGAKRVIQDLGLSEHLAMLERAWDSELGGLAKIVRIVALDRAVLVVEAASAPAVQEISLRRKELVRRLNRHFPNDVIENLTVRIANHG
jgi:hypothetical protein